MAGSVLTPESETILKEIANKIRAEPNLMIDVNGYTDNVGSVSANVTLSKKRADQVKAYLVDNLKVASGRIHAAGLGAQNPIASNETEEGRQENRRVEIVIRKPDALLIWFKNDVKVQPPTIKPDWLDPVPNLYLYRRYKITTGKKSSADILYPNKGVLSIGEDAMVIVHGLELKRKEKPLIRNFELQSGGLKTILKNISSQDDSIIGTPTAVVELYPQSSEILVDEKLKGLISVYQSNADVSAVADKGEDTVVKQGELPEQPRSLPLTPVLVSPQMNEKKFFPDDIIFVWQPSGVLSHLVVAEDSLFQEITFDAYIANDSLVSSLRENRYYWRVSGIDKDSLEGEYSDYRTFIVEIDTLKPQLKVGISPGKQEGEFIVAGHTDTDAELYVNDEKIKTDKDGSFSYNIPKDYQGSSVSVRAVDNAGNTTEISCKIPRAPVCILGVNAGMFRMQSPNKNNTELGYCYGLEFTKMLSRGISFYLNTTMGSIKKEIDNELYKTNIIPFEVGFRKEFNLGYISPFFNIGSGFIWWQKTLNGEVIVAAGDDGRGVVDTSIGSGVGSRFYLGGNWLLNLHANYTHFFSNGQYSFGLDDANTLIRFGLGIQYSM
ncbi:Peptidoglycan-associated lipoprotein [subsurface metagenome]